MSRKTIVLLLFSMALLLPGIVQAQETVSIASLEVDLWPEYDHPDMLVIYRVTLSPQVSLPVDLHFQIPARAGNPNAVAVRGPDGNLFNAPYERSVEGDWATISLTASMPNVQLEYYDPQLIKHGAERNFTFTWPADYPVDLLVIQVQQPLDASQVQLEPGPAQAQAAPDGFTYHTLVLGAQPQGAVQNINVSYLKETETLSVERLQIQPSAPLSETTSGRVSLMEILPWLLGILGLALLIGGGGWYWRTGQQQTQARKPRRSRKRSQPAQTTEDAVYCPQCGKRAASGDRFCRACGTRLRLE